MLQRQRSKVRLWLIGTPRYWHARSLRQKLIFRYKSRRFTTGESLASARLNLKINMNLARWCLVTGLIASTLVALLQVTSQTIDMLPWHLSLGVQASDQSPDGLLIATAGLGATLLGLYFAGLSFIVTSRYASAPANVRQLMLDERVGNAYVRLVSVVVAIALLVIMLESVGYHPSTLTVGAVALAAATCIVSFGVVGLRVFQLLSLEVLSGSVAYDIEQVIIQVAGRRLGKEFEDYERRTLSRLLDTYEELLTMAIDTESSRQVRDLAGQIVALWIKYAKAKPQIPSASMWFERQLVHANWWMTDDSAVGLALNTGTGLQPKQELDHSWVEKRFVAILTRAVASLAERNDVAGMHFVAQLLANNARPMAAALQVSDAVRALGVFTEQPLLDPTKATTDGRSSATTKRNAILDDLGLYVTNLVLGLQDAAATISADDFWDQLDGALKTGATEPGSPMGAVLEVIQEVRDRLDFERQVEGHWVTPSWWIRQQVANNLYRELDLGLARVMAAFGSEVVERASAATDPIDAVTLASRGLELANKLSAHLPTIEETLAGLDATRKCSDVWPTRTSENAASQIQTHLDRTIDVFVKRLPDLATETVEGQPDFFGQAFFVLVNQCFSALLEERDDRFVALVRPMLYGALAAHDRLLKEPRLLTLDPEIQLIARSAVVEDIFEISGYALIRGELGASAVWDGCRIVWDEILAQSNRDDILRLLVLLMSYREDRFGIMPGDIIRTSRHMAFQGYLTRKLGLKDDLLFSGPMFDPTGRRKPEVHSSPVIRFIVGSFGFAEPEDIFVGEYIGPKVPAGTPLPRKAQEAAKSIERRHSVSRSPDEDLDVDDDVVDETWAETMP